VLDREAFNRSSKLICNRKQGSTLARRIGGSSTIRRDSGDHLKGKLYLDQKVKNMKTQIENKPLEKLKCSFCSNRFLPQYMDVYEDLFGELILVCDECASIDYSEDGGLLKG